MRVKHLIVVYIVILFSFSIFLVSQVYSQSIDDLQVKIDQRSNDIKELEKEIANYQKQINELGSQANSLSATIKTLDLTKKKLEADIKITESKVEEKNQEIRKLGLSIDDKVQTVQYNKRIISRSLLLVNEIDSRSIPELLLGQESIGSVWNSLDQLGSIQKGLVDRIKDLNEIKVGLEKNKKSTENAKNELQILSKRLQDQRTVVLSTTNDKNSLLKETKQSEAEYQKILTKTRAQKAAFEKELFEYESALHFAIDFGSLPKKGSQIFSWPLDNIYITQQFGVTSASQRLYASGSHGGVDFRASVGTPVKSMQAGIVTDIERSKAKKGCQYGYWVLVRHANGLSSLYAHLSLVNAEVGQTVSTGQVIGYSGNTGYSEGPHLHLGVYATAGIQIINSEKLNPKTSCIGIKTVAADVKAYLDPLIYLPSL